MNIIFFQNQFCTRALKQAIALKSNVNRLVGITSSENATSIVHQNLIKNTFNKIYNNISTINDLSNIVNIEHPDIIHCHNFPDTQAYISIKANYNKSYKVVHDIHDHGTYQYKKLSNQQKKEEYFCEANADGYIFVSEASKQKLTNDRNLLSPSTVVHSMPNRFSFPTNLPNKNNGKLVYQGGMHSLKGHHRNYVKIFKGITDNNFFLDVFSSTIKRNKYNLPFSFRTSGQKKIFYDYKNINKKYIKIIKSTPIDKLYNKLINYDAGISILNSNDNPYQQLTLPNKIFEYAMCGLPSIVDSKCKGIMDYVKKNNLGIIIDDWSKFNQKDLFESKQFIINNRYEFCMENEIEKSLNLYKEIL